MRAPISTPWLIISMGYALLSGVAYFLGLIGPFGPLKIVIVLIGLAIFVAGSFNAVIENWRYELALGILLVVAGVTGILTSGTAGAFMGMFILLGVGKIGSVLLERHTGNTAERG